MRVNSGWPAVLLLVGVGLGGCSPITDPPAAPARAPLLPAGKTHDLVSNLVTDGTIMSMVGDDGTRYTLDMSAQRITRESDHLVLFLTREQTDSAATAFSSAVMNDPSIPGLEAVGSLGGFSGGCTGVGGSVCEASVPADAMLLEPLRDTVKGHQGKHPLIQRPGSGAASPVMMTSSFFGDPCTNIINAALPKVIQYRGYREGFLQQGFQSGVGKVVGGAVGKALPPGSQQAIAFYQAMGNFFNAGVTVGWLAGNWTTYGCRDANVVAGPYYHAGGTYSTSPTGNVYFCGYETWHISWDYGMTWEAIQVRVCEFMS